MIPPEQLNLPNGSFLRLRRALYGLKQASREWHMLISSILISFGFKQLVSDSCIFSISRNGLQLILILYVDDMIVASQDKSNIQWLFSELSKHFIMKQSILTRCLGIKIDHDTFNKTLSISKNDYVKNLIKKWNHLIDKIPYRSTPMDDSVRLSRSDCPTTEEAKTFMSQFPYREIIGALNYLVCTVRADISFPTNYCARFMDNPGFIHWTNLLNIVAYLRDNDTAYITYKYPSQLSGMQPNRLYVFVDADGSTTDMDNYRPVTACLIFFNGGIISWKTLVQKENSSSITESEYKAIHDAGKEAIWITNILSELGTPLIASAIFLEDNISSIYATQNPVQHSRLKHIKLIYHQIRDWVQDRKIELIKIGTEFQLADNLNKANNSVKFKRFRNEYINVLNSTSTLI